uniref:Uncharacterized protein n=1 Tax=Ditylum brightwellii TaxID=49249 RepID=A0A7S4SI03_9STRA
MDPTMTNHVVTLIPPAGPKRVRRSAKYTKGRSSRSIWSLRDESISEEEKKLFYYFQTCPSLPSLRTEFRNKNCNNGNLNICAETEEITGRSLLHCIGLNERLIMVSTGGSDAAISQINRFIMQELIPGYPSAVTEEDNNNFIPFTEIIIEWVNNRRDTRKSKIAADDLQTISTRAMPRMVEWSLEILSEILDSDLSGDASPQSSFTSIDTSNISYQDLNLFGSLHSARMSPKHTGRKNIMGKQISSMHRPFHREIIVRKIAAIPHLLEELLLIEDKEQLHHIFELSIVRKALLFGTESFGDGKWLIKMLDAAIKVNDSSMIAFSSHREVSDPGFQFAEDECRFLAEAAIFYLECVSKVNIFDDLRVFHKIQFSRKVFPNKKGSRVLSKSDVQQFQECRDELFHNVTALEGLVRRISVMDDDLVKRASVTKVLCRKLDKSISSDFAAALALFDGINHILLVVTFRLGPAEALFYLSRADESFKPHQYIIANVVLVASIVYFATRTIYSNKAKYALSHRLFWSGLFSGSNFLDVVPLVMVLFCIFFTDIILRQRACKETDKFNIIPWPGRIAVALTTPFLWFRILNYIKIRNKHLATVILCFNQL